MKTVRAYALAISASCSIAASAAEVDASAYSPMTVENYPRILERWGAERARSIDRFRETAAKLGAKSSKCDKVFAAELSEAKSSYPQRVVIFVECENETRFYFDFGSLSKSVAQPTERSKAPLLMLNP